MNILQEELIKSGERLKNVAEELNASTRKLIELETKVALIKAELAGSNGIVNLPNQSLRDAEMEKRLQTDENYEPLYREYLEVKTLNKIFYTEWVLAQELNKNVRAMVMNMETAI